MSPFKQIGLFFFSSGLLFSCFETLSHSEVRGAAGPAKEQGQEICRQVQGEDGTVALAETGSSLPISEQHFLHQPASVSPTLTLSFEQFHLDQDKDYQNQAIFQLDLFPCPAHWVSVPA